MDPVTFRQVFGKWLINPDTGKTLAQEDAEAGISGGQTNRDDTPETRHEHDDLMQLLRPRPDMGFAPDGTAYTMMHAMLGRLSMMCPVFTQFMKASLAGGIAYDQLQKMTKGMKSLNKTTEKGVNGIYMLMHDKKKEVQLGQSADLAAMGKDLANNEYKDYLQRVLFVGPATEPRPDVYERAVTKKIIFQCLILKKPAYMSDTHQPLKDEKDDVEERNPLKEGEILLAYTHLYTAYLNGADGSGPKVPPLTLEQPEANIALLLEIIGERVINKVEAARQDPRQVIPLLREALNLDETGTKTYIVRTLKLNMPWDMRGAL